MRARRVTGSSHVPKEIQQKLERKIDAQVAENISQNRYRKWSIQEPNIAIASCREDLVAYEISGEKSGFVLYDLRQRKELWRHAHAYVWPSQFHITKEGWVFVGQNLSTKDSIRLWFTESGIRDLSKSISMYSQYIGSLSKEIYCEDHEGDYHKKTQKFYLLRWALDSPDPQRIELPELDASGQIECRIFLNPPQEEILTVMAKKDRFQVHIREAKHGRLRCQLKQEGSILSSSVYSRINVHFDPSSQQLILPTSLGILVYCRTPEGLALCHQLPHTAYIGVLKHMVAQDGHLFFLGYQEDHHESHFYHWDQSQSTCIKLEAINSKLSEHHRLSSDIGRGFFWYATQDGYWNFAAEHGREASVTLVLYEAHTGRKLGQIREDACTNTKLHMGADGVLVWPLVSPRSSDTALVFRDYLVPE